MYQVSSKFKKKKKDQSHMYVVSKPGYLLVCTHSHTHTLTLIHTHTPIPDALCRQYGTEKGPEKIQEAGEGVWVTSDSPNKKYIDCEARDTPRQEPSITVCITSLQ